MLCACTDDDVVQEDKVEEGFEIGNVDNETLYDDLAVDGKGLSNRGDYSERVGLTQNPISTLSNEHIFTYSMHC